MVDRRIKSVGKPVNVEHVENTWLVEGITTTWDAKDIVNTLCTERQRRGLTVGHGKRDDGIRKSVTNIAQRDIVRMLGNILKRDGIFHLNEKRKYSIAMSLHLQ